MSAAAELASVREQILALKAREVELIGLSAKEAEDTKKLAQLREWLEIRTLFTARENGKPIHAAATSKVWTQGGVCKYTVVAGPDLQILAGWEVTEYRTRSTWNLVYGEPPVEIELQARRVFTRGC